MGSECWVPGQADLRFKAIICVTLGKRVLSLNLSFLVCKWVKVSAFTTVSP